ncbi:MAG: hypothetical protein RIR34_1249 [Actinomycetota bacterium]
MGFGESHESIIPVFVRIYERKLQEITLHLGNSQKRQRKIWNVVFVLLGANYNDVPLEQLESLERHTNNIRQQLLGADTSSEAISGGIVIGTCNRFEVYLDTDHFHQAVEQTIRVVSETAGLDADYVSKVLKVSYGSSVAQHLYSVASGLESMIVGEAEITGQVKRALKDAQEDGQATAGLNALFQTAANVAKQVSNKTGLGAAGRSIISAAIDIHEAERDSVKGKQVLIMGTGAYARVIVAALQRAGCHNILVYSSSGRAEMFSENHDTCALEPEELETALAKVNLVITASGANGHSIDFKMAKQAVANREAEGNGPLNIIDVALSASVAPPVYDLAGVNVLDLDAIRVKAPQEHSESILQAQDIVAQAVEEFETEQATRKIDPVISALRAHVAVWVDEEVERVRKRSGNEAAAEVAHSLHRVTKALLHTPTVNGKNLAKNGNQADYVQAVKTLFGIDLSQFEGDGTAAAALTATKRKTAGK